MSANPTTALAPALPPLVTQTIHRFRLRKTLRTVALYLALTLAVGLLSFAAALLVDRFFDTPLWARLTLTITTFTLAAIPFLLGVAALCKPESLDRLAGQIDDAVPGSRDLLRSSVNFSSPHSASTPATSPAPDRSPFMLEQTLAQAHTLAQNVHTGRLLSWGAIPAAWIAVLLALALNTAMFSSPFMDSHLLLQRFLHPRANLPRPSLTKILVDAPDSQTIQQGDDVFLRATLTGKIPADPRVTVTLTRTNTPSTSSSASPANAPSVLVMNPRPRDQFEATLKNVTESIAFTVSAADGKSESHFITVRPRPALVKLTAQYTYPRYTKLPNKTEPVTRREFRGVEGTRVRLDFETSLPLSASKAILGERALPIHWDKSNTKGTFSFTLERDLPLAIQLTSDNGTNNHSDAPFRVRLTPDNPPSSSLLNVPEDRSFFRDTTLSLAYKGSDDFGVSEVFVRYRQSSAPLVTKDYALENVVGGSKEVAAEFTLPLRDITLDDDLWVEFELIMVDSKGQEGISPNVRLQVISDTPDRQLLELVSFQERYLSSTTRSVRAVDDATSKLGILLEGLNENDTLTGSRRNVFNDITRALSDLQFPLATDDPNYSFMMVSEYPYLAQRRTHDLFARAAMLPDRTAFIEMLSVIEKSTAPRPEIVKLKSRLDEALAPTLAFESALKNTLIETRFTFVGYLASQYLASEAASQTPGKSEKPNDAVNAIFAEKQEIRLRAILQQIAAVAPAKTDTVLIDAIASVQQAAKLPVDKRRQALTASLTVLRDQTNVSLDGRLGVVTENYIQQNNWAALFRTAAAMKTLPRANAGVGAWARLGRNNFYLNPAEAFLAASLQQAAQTNDPSRLNQAINAAAPLQDWSRSSDLYERAESLRRTLAETETEFRTRRLDPASTAYDTQWRKQRELALSLINDAGAGRFKNLSPAIDAGLTKLSESRAAFTPWAAREATDAPNWPVARAATFEALNKLVAESLPRVREGRAKALALANPLLNDIDKNLSAEQSKIAPEMNLLKADVELGYKNPGPPNNITLPTGKVLGRKADAPRVSFTKDLSERFSSYSIAMGAVNDLHQAAWSDNPTQAGVAQLQALTILFEYFSYLDEDVYDKTYAYHLQQLLRVRSYPAYLEETGRYMLGLAKPADVLTASIRQFTAGNAGKLAADPAFTNLPALIGKQSRYDTHLKSITGHLDFLTALDAISKSAQPDAVTRDQLLAILKDSKTPTAYWDRVFFACDALFKQAAAAGKKSPATDWRGIDGPTLDALALSVARIKNMLPPAGDPIGGDEVKTINIALADFANVKTQVNADALAKKDANTGAAAYDTFDEWCGKVQASLSALENRLTINPPKLRPRPRLMQSRADLEKIIGRLVRGEEAWTNRMTLAGRTTISDRAQLLVPLNADLGPDPAVSKDDLAFDFTREGVIRRRSSAATAQSSRSLNLESGDVDEQFLKMPKYLYDELRKTGKKPYPSQFKDNALEYTQSLFKDAR